MQSTMTIWARAGLGTGLGGDLGVPVAPHSRGYKLDGSLRITANSPLQQKAEFQS